MKLKKRKKTTFDNIGNTTIIPTSVIESIRKISPLKKVKPVIITLLYLTFGGNIEQRASFEIATGESCSSWFNRNVKVMENKKKKLFSNHVYMSIKVKK